MSSLLTKNDDLNDFSCHANSILHLQCVVTSVIDGGITDDEVGIFSIAVYFDAIKTVLQFDASKIPGTDGLRFGLYGNVEVDGFSMVHVNNFLRNASQVDLGNHCKHTRNEDDHGQVYYLTRNQQL